jgi:hypothetical protein
MEPTNCISSVENNNLCNLKREQRYLFIYTLALLYHGGSTALPIKAHGGTRLKQAHPIQKERTDVIEFTSSNADAVERPRLCWHLAPTECHYGLIPLQQRQWDFRSIRSLPLPLIYCYGGSKHNTRQSPECPAVRQQAE